MSIRAADNPQFRLPSLSAEECLARMSPDELRERFRALQVLTGAVLAHLALPDLLRELLDRLRQTLGVDTATVLLASDDRRSLVVRASRGLEEEVEQNVRVPMGQGIPGAVAAGRRPVIVDDVSRADPSSPLLQRLSSMMVAPLVVETEVLGVLHVGMLQPRVFSEADLYLLQMVADRAALAIRHALHFERVQAEPGTRRRAESALAEREELAQLLAETAADAIITMDEDGTIVSANPAAAETFGYSLGELIGMRMVQLIPDRLRGAHRQGVRRYLETGQRRIPWRGLELPGLHSSGREVLLEVAFAERVRQGRRLFTGTMRNITERKRTERLLAAQYAVTRVLAEVEVVEEAVPRILEVTGEALGWDLGAFWSWNEGTGTLRPMDLWVRPGVDGTEFCEATLQMEVRPPQGLPGRVKASGRAAWILDVVQDTNFPRREVAARSGLHSAFAFPVCVGGDCIGVVEFLSHEVIEPDSQLLAAMDALGSDIGQFIRRRDAEERLWEQEEIQRFLVQTTTALTASALDYDAAVGMLARLAVPTLADWCTVYIQRDSGAVERLEVAHADPALADLAKELVNHPGPTIAPHPAITVMQTGEPRLFPEVTLELLESFARQEDYLRIVRAVGIRSAMAVPLLARGRTLGAVVLAATDASGRRYDPHDLEVAVEFAQRAAMAIDNARLYQQSQEANRAKTEFLAVMSHELRTPLNAVIGYAELLRLGIAQDEQERAEEYVDRIMVSARHLTELIEEILAYSRLEAGRADVAAVPLRLDQLLEETRTITEPLAVEKGLQLAVHQPEAPIEMVSDPGKLRQILLNLISNAVKFTEEGEVEVSARTERDALVLDVRDTGIGIAPEHREKIFDPFWQVQQGTTRMAGGTGLGLSVTRRLVELLHGELSLQSEPGQGSTFTVRLPLRHPGAPAAEPT